MKSRDGKSQRREEKKKEKVRRKKIQLREKVAKSQNSVFPMICGSGGSKSRLAKAAGAEPAGQMRDKNLHAVVAKHISKSQCAKKHHARTTFGSCDVEKVHVVVARLDVQMSFRVGGARDCAPCQK